MDAIGRAFTFAREAGHPCGPADFLVGIADGAGAAATALDPPGAVPLREAASAMHHHRDVVSRLIAQARPDLAARPFRRPVPLRGPAWRLGLTAWLGNRQASVRLRLLRLRTRRVYRDCPAP